MRTCAASLLLLLPLLAPNAASGTRTLPVHDGHGVTSIERTDLHAPTVRPEDRGAARASGSRSGSVVWHRHHDTAIYSSTGIASPAGIGFAGNWWISPVQVETVPLDGDGTTDWVFRGTEFFVDASRNGTVLAGIDFGDGDSTGVVRRWDAASETPLWHYDVHPCRALTYQGWASRKPIQVSDDGSTIVVGASMWGSPNFGRVFVFDAGDSTPTTFDIASSSITAVELSADGRFLAVAAWPTVYVFDRDTASLRWSGPIGAGNDALALSADGRYLAWGWTTFYLKEWTGSSYSPVWTYDRPGTWYVGQCAFSDDDSLLALAWDNGSTEPNRTLVDLHELPSLALRWEYDYGTVPAVGHTDVPSRMLFERGGHHFAVASWGGAFPELHVFEEASSTPIYTLDTPGSLFDVDIATAGGALRVTTCGKDVHAGTGGSGGDSYSVLVDTAPVGAPQGPALSTGIALAPVRPSPLRTSARIAYALREPGVARLTVCDVSGRRIATLFEGPESAGWHSVEWSGRAGDGTLLPSGVYFLRLDAAGRSTSRKVTILR